MIAIAIRKLPNNWPVFPTFGPLHIGLDRARPITDDMAQMLDDIERNTLVPPRSYRFINEPYARFIADDFKIEKIRTDLS